MCSKYLATTSQVLQCVTAHASQHCKLRSMYVENNGTTTEFHQSFVGSTPTMLQSTSAFRYCCTPIILYCTTVRTIYIRCCVHDSCQLLCSSTRRISSRRYLRVIDGAYSRDAGYMSAVLSFRQGASRLYSSWMGVSRRF